MEYFDTRLERAKKAFDEKKNSVDFVKEFAGSFSGFKEASCRGEVDRWLLDQYKHEANNEYEKFIESDAFGTIVKKEKLLSNKSDLRITKRENRWVCVKKSSQKDMLVFDDDTFKRNDHISKLSPQYSTVDDRPPFNENKYIKISDNYYWYKDIYIKNDKNEVFVYNSEGKIYKLSSDGAPEEEYQFDVNKEILLPK